MEPISLQLMYPNCKLVHTHIYTVPRSVEWVSPSVAIPKKNGLIRVVTDFRKFNLLLKHRMSPISYSKYWGHDPFNVRLYLCISIVLKYGILSH
jgi:hypothetical protein